MTQFVKLVDLRNEVEAGLLDAVLKEKNIPHAIRSLHDEAFDGAYQAFIGWGWVEGPEEERKQVADIYNDIIRDKERQNIVEDSAGADSAEPEKKEEDRKTKRLLVILLVSVIGILLVFLIASLVWRDLFPGGRRHRGGRETVPVLPAVCRPAAFRL